MRSIITTATVAALALIGPLAADAEAQLVQQNGLDSTHCLIRRSCSPFPADRRCSTPRTSRPLRGSALVLG